MKNNFTSFLKVHRDAVANDRLHLPEAPLGGLAMPYDSPDFQEWICHGQSSNKW